MRVATPYVSAGLIVTILLVTAAHAGDAGRESPFSVGIGARSLGMGGGYAAVSDDAAAVYYNPAGLPLLQHQEVSFMHMTLLEGTIFDAGSWACPVPRVGGFGAAFMRLGTGDIGRRIGYEEVGTFDYSHSQFLLSFGRYLTDGLAVGASAKLVHQSLDVYSDYGFGLDVAGMLRVYRYIGLGGVIRDAVRPSLTLLSASETLPRSLAGGVAIRAYPLSDRLLVSSSFELEKTADRSVKIHCGAEIQMDSLYAVRVGYDRDNLAFGVGYRFGRLKLDYAYKLLDYIEDSHRFSLAVLIGSSVREREARLRLEEERRGTALLEDERQRQFASYRQKADAFRQRHQLDSALTYYQRALAFDEDNAEIAGCIAACKEALEAQRSREERIQESRQDLQRTIDSYLAQARSFYEKKYYAASGDVLDLVLDIDSTNGPALRLKDQLDKAVDEEVAELAARGRRAVQSGEWARAVEAYGRVLDISPGNDEARQAREEAAAQIDMAGQLTEGIGLYNTGRYDEAQRALRSVLAVDRYQPVALEYLAKVDSALSVVPSIDVISKDARIWPLYLEGLRCMRGGEYDNAIEAWEKVLEAYPGNPHTLNNIEQARLRLQSETNR